MKRLKVIIITLIMVLSFLSVQNTSKNKMPLVTKIEFSKQIKSFKVDKIIQRKDDNIGYIEIKKINLNKKLYSPKSIKNDVNKNVTILKDSTFPNEKESTMIIAAHSGTGKLAYFKNLNKLTKGDVIKLNLNNKSYHYIVQNKWEVLKTGTIIFPFSEHKQLILTTCSPTKDNYQLIIDCKIKE